MAGRLAAPLRQQAERVVAVVAEPAQAFVEVAAVPEVIAGAGLGQMPAQPQRLEHDRDPGQHRHAEQNHRDAAGDPVALLPDMGEAELRFHFAYSSTKLIGTLNHMASGTPLRLAGR